MDDLTCIFSKITQLKIGKKIGNTIYIHRSVQEALIQLPLHITHIANEKLPNWNCLKISIDDKTISFLLYTNFDDIPHPTLSQALTIHPEKMSARLTRYRDDRNPPILHRKELLVGTNHPRFDEWSSITRTEENLGLYDNPRTIGFLDNWTELLKEKGLAKEPKINDDEVSVERHKTAISRTSLSKPVQALLSAGLLTPKLTFFDYGCGKGDDIENLKASGFSASGWDPVHSPHSEKLTADVVNLGFVLNVIENPAERIRVLHDSFSLARSILCVAVLVENMQTAVNLRPYKDGYLTSRNTFQKYYNQSELAQLLEDVLQKPAAAVSPGVFFVFQRRDEAENFFISRTHRDTSWTEWGIKRQWSTSERTQFKRDRFFQENEVIIENFWKQTMELGRFPVDEEFDGLDQLVVKAGAFKHLRAWIVEHFGADAFEKALQQKREDLVVYLALRHFQKRLSLKELPRSIQRDIQACFSSYSAAWDTAKGFLFQIGKPDIITEKCNSSIKGTLDEQALFVTPEQVKDLDPVLRIYIQTGELFFGDRYSVDEIKIHKRSGKVTFLTYEEPKSLKKTKYRTKVNLLSQKVEFYDHSSYEVLKAHHLPHEF